MNEQMDVAQATSTDEERTRLDRRTAMRVALGGAAAGATFMAPRIDGLSVAPDYAAAATACTIGAAGTSVNIPGPAEKYNLGNWCLNTRCWGLCFAGGINSNQSGCDMGFNCPNNAGNYDGTNDSNGANTGVALNLLGSELRYAVAGSQKWTGNYCGNWSNDSRAHMKINTKASPFNKCEATMSISCNQNFNGRMKSKGTDNNNHSNDVGNSDPTSWTRSTNDPNTAWNTRWILGCVGFKDTNPNPIANGNNGVTNGVSSVTINFKCFCNS